MAGRFTTNSVRLNILEAIKALYVAATDKDDPTPSNKVFYGVTFSVVEIGPLGPPDARKANAIGIVAGNERKSDLYPLKTALLPVSIEFRITKNQGDIASGPLAERMLAVVQQILYDGGNLGGLVIKCDERGNDVDLYTYGDRTIMGVVHFEAHYRHHTLNVYNPDPSE